MSDNFLGEIKILGSGNHLPRYYARCDGAVLSINQNQALFALMSTKFGGDGVSTFALPDMRGRLLKAVSSNNIGTRFDPGSTADFPSTTAGSGFAITSPPFVAVNFIIALCGYWPSR